MLVIILFLFSSQPGECFFFKKKKSDFPSADFRSTLLFRDSWNGMPRIFFGMFSDDIEEVIGKHDGEEMFHGLTVLTFNKTGIIYALNDYREKELIGFMFKGFSPVCGNRVAEGYARQAGWTTCSSPDGQKYLERYIRNWEGSSVEMVYWVEDDREILVDKEAADLWGLLPE